MVKDTRYIISFDVNEQLLIMVQKTHKVKETARQFLQRSPVNATWPDKWSCNTGIQLSICLLQQYAMSLVMKLQLMIAKLNASLEDQSDMIISNLLPRLLREVESLQHETVNSIRFSSVHHQIVNSVKLFEWSINSLDRKISGDFSNIRH